LDAPPKFFVFLCKAALRTESNVGGALNHLNIYKIGESDWTNLIAIFSEIARG